MARVTAPAFRRWHCTYGASLASVLTICIPPIYVYFQSVFSIPQKHATGTSENWLKIHIYRWNADSELWKFWIMKIDWKYTYCLRPLYTYTPGRPKVSCEMLAFLIQSEHIMCHRYMMILYAYVRVYRGIIQVHSIHAVGIPSALLCDALAYALIGWERQTSHTKLLARQGYMYRGVWDSMCIFSQFS